MDGPAADGAGAESGGWRVHAARRPGSVLSQGPLQLPGEELGGASLRLRLRER